MPGDNEKIRAALEPLRQELERAFAELTPGVVKGVEDRIKTLKGDGLLKPGFGTFPRSVLRFHDLEDRYARAWFAQGDPAKLSALLQEDEFRRLAPSWRSLSPHGLPQSLPRFFVRMYARAVCERSPGTRASDALRTLWDDWLLFLGQDDLQMLTLGPLVGLSCETDTVPLSNGVDVERITPEERLASKALASPPYDQATHAVKIRWTSPKNPPTQPQSVIETLSGEFDAPARRAERVRDTIRCIAEGDVYMADVFHIRLEPPPPQTELQETEGVRRNPFEPAQLDGDGAAAVRQLWGHLELAEGNTKLSLGLSRIGMAVEGARPLDRLLDLFIAAEALYAPRGADMESCAAALLGIIPEERLRIIRLVRSARQLRNKIVHGSHSIAVTSREDRLMVDHFGSLVRRTLQVLAAAAETTRANIDWDGVLAGTVIVRPTILPASTNPLPWNLDSTTHDAA